MATGEVKAVRDGGSIFPPIPYEASEAILKRIQNSLVSDALMPKPIYGEKGNVNESVESYALKNWNYPLNSYDFPTLPTSLTEVQKERVRRLLELLRSGRFSQGNQFLKQESDGQATYCCLGVAAEHVLGYVFTPSKQDSNVCAYKGDNVNLLASDDAKLFGFDRDVTKVERERIAKMSGLRSALLDFRKRQRILASLNDNGVKFETIAAIVVALGWDEH